jgi:hypothetical protein
MTDEPITVGLDEPAAPAPAPAQEAAEPAPAAPKAETTPSAPEAPERQAEGEADEREKELARLAFERREARRRARELEAEVARMRAAQAQASPQNADPQAEVERRANERAMQLVARQRFDEECNRIYETGVKEFGEDDFKTALAGFREVGGLPPALIEAAAETGEAAKVLRHLGKDPEQVEKLLTLPPHRLGAAVGKIAAQIAAPPKPKPVSKAPPPITTVDGAGSADSGLRDDLPMDEWASRWKKQREAQIRGR